MYGLEVALVSQDTLREVSDATLHFYRSGSFPATISHNARAILDERFAILDAEDKLHGFGLSPKQQLVANTVLDTFDRRSTAAKLKALGVDTQVYQLWLRDNRFQRYMREESARRLELSEIEANTSLIHRATSGDTQALKFFYELTGKFNANDQALGQTLKNMEVVVQVLLELISKYLEPSDVLLLVTELEARTGSHRDAVDTHSELMSEVTPARPNTVSPDSSTVSPTTSSTILDTIATSPPPVGETRSGVTPVFPEFKLFEDAINLAATEGGFDL